MTTFARQRRWSALAGSALILLAPAAPAMAQDGPWRAPDSYNNGSYDNGGYRQGAAPSANDAYVPRGDTGAPRQNEYAAPRQNEYAAPRQNEYAAPRDNGYAAAQRDNYGTGQNDAYSPNSGSGGYATEQRRPDPYAAGSDAYSPTRERQNEAYGNSGRQTDPGGYGEPYAPPPGEGAPAYSQGGPPPSEDRHYSQNEIIQAGHGFFGAISKGLAEGVEYVFKSQGRPNGYILGEDAGGAFVVGLRYGEGRLFTKDAGEHKVFWQGPTVGYDAGAEGSKTMVLVYNLRDPAEIYERFGGVEGSAYLVGGVSVVFQKYNDVTLAVIRSGVGLRLGANVGYLKYTRAPTWNPL
ncbi:EipA family protein [Hyphomicrobium sp.]|uniref:DUF1134 domain-containing protein n=1 Tax=Hyphomicrobium sp. TaxID=82 RepID=UPI003F6FC379